GRREFSAVKIKAEAAHLAYIQRDTKTTPDEINEEVSWVSYHCTPDGDRTCNIYNHSTLLMAVDVFHTITIIAFFAYLPIFEEAQLVTVAVVQDCLFLFIFKSQWQVRCIIAGKYEIHVKEERKCRNLRLNKEKDRDWEIMKVIVLCEGKYNLCCDGNTFSGVIRDGKGKWILGYNRFLGKYSVAVAELWGILDGLLLLQKQGYDEVTVQLDNLENVISICESKLGGPKNSLIRRIQQILAFEEKWLLIYVPRETNRAADALAKMGLLSGETLHMFEDPPLEIKEISKDDNTFDNLSTIYSM
ncbi:hypothetical protein Godav_028340, partial [Gossypium davidsonii]|nr:hypothetical protein [Gossypium davidsonii]